MEKLSSATYSVEKRKWDLSPSQNEQSGKLRSDDEDLDVHIPRPAANFKPAHLDADLSPLLTVEVKRALENGENFANHRRSNIPGDFLQYYKLFEAQTFIKVGAREQNGILSCANFNSRVEMLESVR